jgi:ABC-type uncharacterized transport system substrate-binding protein
MNELGYIEGRNMAIEYRWAEGNYGRVPALAADLLSRRVALIVATGGDATAKIASNVTTNVPVLIISDDPVRFGIVDSLNRPGANVTGVAVLNSILGAKPRVIQPDAEDLHPSGRETHSAPGHTRGPFS